MSARPTIIALAAIAAVATGACTDSPAAPAARAADLAGATSALNSIPAAGARNLLVSFPGWDSRRDQALTLTGRLYLPAAASTPARAIVALHGCGGLYTASGRTFAEFTTLGTALADSGYAVLFVDSFGPRSAYFTGGVCGDDSNTKIDEAVERVEDAYHALAYLRTLTTLVRADSAAIVGWSNGGTAAMSAMASTDNPVVLPAQGGFTRAAVVYGGCGMSNRYDGLSKSTWRPYAPTRVITAGLDPLHTNCVTRVNLAHTLGTSAADLQLVTYANAKHGFNRAGVQSGSWTQADLDARAASHTLLFAFLK